MTVCQPGKWCKTFIYVTCSCVYSRKDANVCKLSIISLNGDGMGEIIIKALMSFVPITVRTSPYFNNIQLHVIFAIR